MLQKVLRDLVVSHLRDGRSVPEIFPFFKNVCSIRTLYRISAENRKEPSNKAKKRKQQPLRKVTPNMVCRMVRLLTGAHCSFRSVAKLLGISEGTIRSYEASGNQLLQEDHTQSASADP
jgi:hypothetical protein